MAGRPTVRNEEVNRKMEEAAALGSSIEEIAFYAGIHRDTLYSWMKDDKDLSDRIRELQEKPILKARQTIVKSLDEPEHAKWYLERKRRKEFATRHEEDHSGGLQIQIVNYQDDSNTTSVQPETLSTPLPSEQSEIQDTDIPSESREVSDAPERTDTEGESY